MNEKLILLSGLVLGIWVYLVLLHGRYWLERPRKAPVDGPKHWPEVVAIVPAPFLPLTALFYLAATIDSARRRLVGRGGEWKGRLQAQKQA